MTFVMLDFRHL